MCTASVTRAPDLVNDLRRRERLLALPNGEGPALVGPELVLTDARASGMGPAEFAKDGLQPTPAGHCLIADAWLAAARP